MPLMSNPGNEDVGSRDGDEHLTESPAKVYRPWTSSDLSPDEQAEWGGGMGVGRKMRGLMRVGAGGGGQRWDEAGVWFGSTSSLETWRGMSIRGETMPKNSTELCREDGGSAQDLPIADVTNWMHEGQCRDGQSMA